MKRTSEGTGRLWNVVLADDNDDHALLIKMALERAAPGMVSVTRARNGDEALELVLDTPPDLLLLDLNMPGRSGHEVLERVKGDEKLRRVPVAVLTSSDRDEDVARSYGLGGNHFITKPADPQELENRLRILLKNLAELEGVRRGGGGVPATGTSALGPATFHLKRTLPWLVLGGLLLILVVWVFIFSGLTR
ncbi:MAG: response regulator [Gemmatimonadota bacterium]